MPLDRIIRGAILLIAIVVVARAFPADITAASPTTPAATDFYDNARDMLQRFGHTLQATGTSVKDSLQRGFDYSKQRVGAAIQTFSRRDNGTAAVDPMLAAASTPIEKRSADQTVESVQPSPVPTDNGSAKAANNSDSIIFRTDDDESDDDNRRIFRPANGDTAASYTSSTTEMLPTENPVLDNNSTDPVVIDDRIIIDVPVPSKCAAPQQKDKQGRCRTVV